jgi:omega-6 fatty acid desaturase (delta-12 desaturase)
MTAHGDSRWQETVAPYAGADALRSVAQLVSTLAFLAAGFVATYWSSIHAPLLAIVLVPVTAAFLVRSFMLMHDCSHGSLFRSRRANDIVGACTGVLAMTPFDQWRRDHAIHHASSGDLERRGHGDITTWTVREYLAKSPRERFFYRLSRHPALVVLGGPFYLVWTLRFRTKSKATGPRQLRSVWGTNVAIALLLTATVWLWGWRALAVYLTVYYLAAVAGVWLFYVQHQFEDAYWEDHANWDYHESAMRGSSYLKLPGILRWFTANIGLHHVHHLAPKIPNYRLKTAFDENPSLQGAPVVTIRSGIAALRLALWDEDQRKLVRFKDVRAQTWTSAGELPAR